jgi:hypothetical protein
MLIFILNQRNRIVSPLAESTTETMGAKFPGCKRNLATLSLYSSTPTVSWPNFREIAMASIPNISLPSDNNHLMIPQTVVLSKDGKIVFQKYGYQSGGEDAMEALLKELSEISP